MKQLLVVVLALAAAAPAQDRKAHRLPRVDLTVADFDATGYILDIGGGGEGVIGRMKPQQVVAIDLFKSELLEAPAGFLKIVMDASDMKFLDASFDTTTAFFSLMYMKPDTQEKVFAEAFRVLKPGGRFLIWDAVIPTTLDKDTQFIVFYFNFKLPKETVRTGYGAPWPDRPLDLSHYRALARKTGFNIVSAKEDERTRTITMELRKPQVLRGLPLAR